MFRINALAAALALTLLAACQPAPPKDEVSRSGPLRVTATTGMIADTARAIAGDLATVSGLMGPGVDPHLYKASQGDLEKLRDADLVLYNGLHLEGRMVDVLVGMASRVRTVQVTDSIPEDLLREPPEFEGHFDPHVWFDMRLWRYVAERIRDALSEADPANASAYAANTTRYLEALDTLHAYATERLDAIPEQQRVLITAHDAFGYFGDAYGFEVMGLQGISTASEYGLQDLERLIDVIVSRQVKAVFVETSVSPKSIEALVAGVQARGHDLKIGGALYSDALGEADGPAGTYLGMVRSNVDTIADALK